MKHPLDQYSEGAPRWLASPVTLHAVQCARCLKWRVVPTKLQYEAIRECILEQPWVCENGITWRPDSHCDLPADIQQDRTMLWAIDKPNIPSAPNGWDRQITVRTDGSSKFADVYYTSPLGNRLRSKVEIEKYINKHPQTVLPETTMDQFSFAIPRPLPGLCPQLTHAGGKLVSPNSQVAQEEHEEPQLASQSPDRSASNEASSTTIHPPRVGNTHPPLRDDGDLVFVDGSSRRVDQVPPPQSMEHRPPSSKRADPGLTPPIYKRTKQQIKRDRLSMDTQPQLRAGSTSGITSDGDSVIAV